MDHAIVGDDPPRQCQQEGHGLLGDAFLVGSRCDRHGDLVRGRGRHVDQVVADAGPCDRPQARSDREQIARHAFAAGEHRVDLRAGGDEAARVSRRNRPPGRRLEAGVGQDLAESARLVAKQVGTDQNSGHGQLDEIVVIIAGNEICGRRAAVFLDRSSAARGLRRPTVQLILTGLIQQPGNAGGVAASAIKCEPSTKPLLMHIDWPCV